MTTASAHIVVENPADPIPQRRPSRPALRPPSRSRRAAAAHQQQVEEIGGHDAVYELMSKTAEEMIPGLAEATENMVQMGNRHHWFAPTCIGPKLPRKSPSVEGLYYVGDGSRPSGGVWTEAAASCGILGARDIIAARVEAPA